jgi:hypothetical protein
LNAKDERDVERAYSSEIERIGYKFISANGQKVDGILTDLYNDKLEYAIAEFKYDVNLKDRSQRSKLLLQPTIYLYRMEKVRSSIPPSLIIGDKNYCFSIDSQPLRDLLFKYTSSNKLDYMDWEEGGVAPSIAYKNKPEVVELINNELSIINPLLYNISNPEVELKDIIDSVVEKYNTNKSTIKISLKNIISVYSVFKNSVVNLKLEKKENESEIKFDNRLIHIFFDILTDEKHTTLNEKNNDILLNRGETIRVFGDQYHSFKKTYCEYKYESIELSELVASKDILIDEMNRRRNGAFFTPNKWVKKAHEMIAEQFGKDWKEKYVAWDCASGTNNLTRDCDYSFKELYNSTLEQGDIDTVNNMKYKGTNFKYDFLNDDIENLPNGLKKTFTEKKPILFLINPPYGTAKSGTLKRGECKKGIADNKVGIKMKENKIGACSQQLYAQFLYRIIMIKEEYNLENIKICIFCPPLFMSGEGYEKFRNVFYKHFDFKDGMLFKASNFSDVSGEFGISFTMWEGKSCC